MSDTLEAPERQAAADAAANAAQDKQFVTFCVAGEMFAVPMAPVQEIIRVPDVARLPLAPPALDGLANLRGRVLPIMNLRRLFNTEELAHDDATRALVINLGQPLGFVVDRVASVLSVEPGEIETAQAIQSIVQAEYLTGVINRRGSAGEHQLMLVLDFQRLVDDQFAGMAGGGAVGSGSLAQETRGEAPADAAAADELRLVSFTVCEQEYAIDIADVQEIVQLPSQITAVPNTPRHVLGLISLRQRLLPLVSLRSLFGLARADMDEHHRIVVVSVPGGGQVGLVTDSVKEVLSVPRAQADAMPGALSRDGALQEFESICRLDNGKRLVSIIATERLLGMQAIRDAVSAAGDAASINARKQDADMSTQQQRQNGGDDDMQVVIFRLGAEEFGVPIMSVQEIVRVPEVLTRVPKTPRFVEGVINLRGTVLPVIDQRTRLGMDAIERNDRQRIMVYTLGGLRTGFIVDSVAEVLRIGRGHIEPAPALSDEQGRLITEVAKLDSDKRLVMLIDPSQLLGARERSAMEGLLDADAGPRELPLARAA
ncbi:chemotaxis protein CheW [Aquabacterium sp. OR-4]|uniref:chemotaxis protein CheW n=1 Tax=Aquabacterium sp. OR-4 TaxID=2978127 RepID=UPI0021B2B5F7|nr:chemotaxis protein CheW [Aquabacterium sp. OR-4]MDT7835964.1 chemotaxis protein CheW [Aquabacterium sp. OR-4]